MAFHEHEQGPQAGLARICTLAFWVLLALFEAFLFFIPVFPSSDGPLHIYLSSIMWKVATHSSQLYMHDFTVRHLVQPYSFHYYLLILLEHWVSSDVAEKCFVGLIWFTIATGFRRLTKVLGPGYPQASLLIFPMLFSWPLGGGFFNYVFSTGLMLFALSFYLQISQRSKAYGALALFSAILVLLVLSHPLPLMLLIFIMGMHIAMRFLMQRADHSHRWNVTALTAFGLACIAFLFPIMIADKADVASNIKSDFGFHTEYIWIVARGLRVNYFFNKTPLGFLYDACILLLFPFSIWTIVKSGLRQRIGKLNLTDADCLLFIMLVYLALTFFFPANMNGSALFADRMWFMVWVVGTTTAAGVAQRIKAQKATALVAVTLALWTIANAFGAPRAAALKQKEIEEANIPSHARGLFLQTVSGDQMAQVKLSYAVLFWEAGRAFAAHEDTMLNTPWLQLTIVPVAEKGRSGLLRDFTPNEASENPNMLADYLEQHPAQKAEALQHADFLLFADPAASAPNPMQFAHSFLSQDWNKWSCTRQNFFVTCLKKPVPASGYLR